MNLLDYDNIIFDLDGVLICTKEMCMHSYRAVLDDVYGVDFRKGKFPDELLATFVEIPFSQKLKENGISDSDIEKILPLYYKYNEKFSYLNKKVDKMIEKVKNQKKQFGQESIFGKLKSRRTWDENF